MARESTGSRHSASPTRKSAESHLQERDLNVPRAGTSSQNNDKDIKSASDAVQFVKNLSREIGSSVHPATQAIVDKNLLRRASSRRRASNYDTNVDISILRSPSRRRQDSRREAGDTSSSQTASSSDPLEPEWEVLKRHPEQLDNEENATKDYFRRLKMIQIEQETQNIFIHDTNDDTQTIYSAAQVQHLESEARELKAQLKKRKVQFASVRRDIEQLTTQTSIFDNVKVGLAEAQQLSGEIQDMELELSRLEAMHGLGAQPDNDELLMRVPALGTFTTDEAEDILNKQVLAMESLEESQSTNARDIESAKKELAAMTQAMEHLQVERNAAEKAAREAKAANANAQNHKLEAVCRGYRATAALLKSLLGIVSIEAPSDNSLRALYAVQDAAARQRLAEVALVVFFDSAGDRINSFKLETKSGQDVTAELAPPSSCFESALKGALKANDASLLVHEALVCMEAMARN